MPKELQDKKALQVEDDGAEMPFLDHLEQLRKTIIKCVIALGVACLFVSFFVVKFNDLLMYPYIKAQADFGQEMPLPRVSSMFSPFFVMFEIAIFGGIFLALPFVLYFLTKFVAPALSRRERRVLTPGVVASIVLFSAGACMAFFFILPTGLRVSFELSRLMNWEVLFDVSNYYSMIVWVPLGAGASFELPLLMVLLIYVGILSPKFLRKNRRIIFVAILIFSAAVTPPDPVTLFLLSVPLYTLYELALFFGDKLLKRKLAREKAEEDEAENDASESSESDIEKYRRRAALPAGDTNSTVPENSASTYTPTSDDDYFNYVDESYKYYQDNYERSLKEAQFDFSPHFTEPVIDFSPHFESKTSDSTPDEVQDVNLEGKKSELAAIESGESESKNQGSDNLDSKKSESEQTDK